MAAESKRILRMDSRKGREMQRYSGGRRQVVGCIPYRLVNCELCSSPAQKFNELEVLLVSSQKGQAMMFPKGGWETDETMEEAAERESLEEAGVLGKVQPQPPCLPGMGMACRRLTLSSLAYICYKQGALGVTITEMLGTWAFKSKSQEMFHDGYMFPLLVERQLDQWPEKHFRQRRWAKVSEVKELCPYPWMKEALEKLEQRLCNRDSGAPDTINQEGVCSSFQHSPRVDFSVDSTFNRVRRCVRRHRTLSSEALCQEVFAQPMHNAS